MPFGTNFHASVGGAGGALVVPGGLEGDLELVIEALVVGSIDGLEAGEGLEDELLTRAIEGYGQAVLVNLARGHVIANLTTNLDVRPAGGNISPDKRTAEDVKGRGGDEGGLGDLKDGLAIVNTTEISIDQCSRRLPRGVERSIQINLETLKRRAHNRELLNELISRVQRSGALALYKEIIIKYIPIGAYQLGP